ncbi:cell division protein FtsQ/DivIB [Sphingomicrobium astaxanthinifaciens]|uniref:cell division protein FtsQ/DivIB n=1 Tax=Sphingomicrobium astaxanthinifaciens TaxID=1227949 RepID=UPI001FCAF06B|nr:cell division protein FtsQ/DivIB [Sphingomicrobium astaxanthinifaciens]MCJ7421643.1 FtsQ-type POTRA domain-containing protein [Sphingomicrobium astaxanthinifaciens]
MARGGTRKTRKKPAPKKRAAKVQATPGADRLLRRTGIAAALVALVALLFALGLPGMAGRAIGSGLGEAGLEVKRIDISGVEQMDPDAIYRVALGEHANALPLVDLEGLRAQLLDFPYVKDARVSRRYPDALVIDMVERVPAALWQGEDRLFLVDAEGVVLERVRVAQMPDLPLLIGAGANRELAQLERLLARVPALAPQLASARWVGGRRWDLNVQTGEILVLPEGEREAGVALEKFMALDAKAALLGIGVERYDLRLPGKAVARSPQFVGAREEASRAAARAEEID